jgi:hypothetical protein
MALKTHLIWQKLGNPAIFPDAIGVDHPPFYANSKLRWIPVEKTECILIGLMEGFVSTDRAKRFIERKLRREERLKRALESKP